MIHNLSFTQSEQARAEALNFIQGSLRADLWKSNSKLIEKFKIDLDQHVLFQHPILARLRNQELNKNHLKVIHINYLNCIVSIFTDALSMVIFQAKALENHQNIITEKSIVAKVYARYLLSLNLFDELGFDTANLNRSSPAKSHLSYYVQILRKLNIDPISHHTIEAQAFAIRDFIAEHHDSYLALLLILSITEKQVIVFSEALHLNLKKFGTDFDAGYYSCHGFSGHSENLANDDNHENDLWTLFIQAISLEDAANMDDLLQSYLSLWNNFWSKMHTMALENRE